MSEFLTSSSQFGSIPLYQHKPKLQDPLPLLSEMDNLFVKSAKTEHKIIASIIDNIVDEAINCTYLKTNNSSVDCCQGTTSRTMCCKLGPKAVCVEHPQVDYPDAAFLARSSTNQDNSHLPSLYCESQVQHIVRDCESPPSHLENLSQSHTSDSFDSVGDLEMCSLDISEIPQVDGISGNDFGFTMVDTYLDEVGTADQFRASGHVTQVEDGNEVGRNKFL